MARRRLRTHRSESRFASVLGGLGKERRPDRRSTYHPHHSTAVKRSRDSLGVVYTPVAIVDFMLRSADELLRSEFGQGLTDENVHILDGFVVTGAFITRLMQSGLITAANLPRKYANELHA